MLNPGAARLFRDFSLRYIYIIWCIILCIYYVSKSICYVSKNICNIRQSLVTK